MTISDQETTLERVVTGWKKNALQTIEVQLPGSDFYLTVLALKGNKFIIAENTILENITIGSIHSSFPKMADHGHWKNIGSKTWADNAYKLEDEFNKTESFSEHNNSFQIINYLEFVSIENEGKSMNLHSLKLCLKSIDLQSKP